MPPDEPDLPRLERIMAKNEMRLFELGLMERIEQIIAEHADSEEQKQLMRRELLVVFDAVYSAGYADGVETGAGAILQSVQESVNKMKDA